MLTLATTSPSLRQLVEQGLGLLQIRRAKALGEPAVDRSEKVSGLSPLPLIAQPPRELYILILQLLPRSRHNVRQHW